MKRPESSFISVAVFLIALQLTSATYYIDIWASKCPDGLQKILPCYCVSRKDYKLVIECESSNLASLSLGLNNLASLEYLVDKVTIKKYKLHTLYGTLFFKSNFEEIHFLDTPVQHIDPVVFNGVNESLRILEVRNSEFTSFPTTAFQPLGNLKVLILDGHAIESLEKNIVVNSSLPNNLEKLHLINGNLSEVPIETFQAFKKLKTLDLHNNSITALQKNQFKNLRDLEVLDISHNDISKMENHNIADLIKLGWLNVSHNAIADLPRGLFARNSVLKLLNLSHNRLQKLDTNTFRGMRFLRRLFLNDNRITDIGRGTFNSITRIGTIDLSRNFLKKLDFQMFSLMNYIEVIDVAENHITEIQKSAFKDVFQCHINISHNLVSKFEAGAFENCINITLLDLSYNNITKFAKNAFDANTFATELQFSYNFMTDMGDIPLNNMTGLKTLNVSNNRIEKIPKNTFPKLYELHTIDASYNNISNIANDIFKPLLSLQRLNLSRNSLKEIKSQVFGTLPTLYTMDLSFNEIRKIAKGSLAKLTTLRFLDLNDNRLEGLFQLPISLTRLNLANNLLTEIPDNTWPVMNSLLDFDMSNNTLGDSLTDGSFNGLLTLQRLNLNMNGITSPPFKSLLSISTLQYLFLEDNNITELRQGAFGRLPTVFEINLSNNQIDKIENRAFEGLLQLLHLNLSSNVLSNISMEAFGSLVSLQTLDLSHNILQKFNNKTSGIFDLCYSLKNLNLSHNEIGTITRKIFPSNQYIPYQLQNIDLSYNKLSVLTKDLTYGTQKVKSLNISHNLITDIKPHVIGNLTDVEVLDLSYNDIEDLTHEEAKFKFPSNATHLFLQNNKIARILDESFKNLTNIKEINLSNNELTTFSPTFVDKMKQNSTKIYFADNPLQCDCHLRPLKYYLQSLPEPLEEFSNVRCDQPSLLATDSVSDLDPVFLQCPDGAPDNQNGLFNELSDLMFNEIYFARGFLIIKWYVSSTGDVGDFYMSGRDSENNVVFDETITYDTRYVQIDGKKLMEGLKEKEKLNICMFAKSTEGVISGWFESQCIKLNGDFKKIITDHHEKINKIYIILGRGMRRNSYFNGQGGDLGVEDLKSGSIKKTDVGYLVSVLIVVCRLFVV